MGTTNFDVVKANAFVGGGVAASYPISPFANTYFVSTTGADGNSGLSPSEPLLTIAQAITLTTSGQGDHVVIGPGTYTITAALVPKARTVFRAAVINPRAPTATIASALTGDMITVDVDGVVFQGIQFKATGAGIANLVDVADTAAVDGLTFDSCVFHGNDQTTVVGIQADDGTFATNGLVVKNCLFRDLTGTHIDVGVLGIPYADIQYNQFAIDINSGTAIALADTSAFATGKAFIIANNIFTGFDATADEVGITIAGTENTTGAGIITNNRFAYLAAAAITINKISLSTVLNYVGDAGTGGTLVSPGS